MIVLPSRGRPTLCARFFAAYLKTGATEPGVLVIERREVGLYADVVRPPRWETWVVDPDTALRKVNAVARLAPNEDRYLICADDLTPETPEWDARLRAASGPDGVAYGHDGFQGGRIIAHPCIGGDFVRAAGHLLNPEPSHFYSDTMIGDVARALGVLRYLPDVAMTHRHFTNGGQWDATYAARGNPEADRTVYEAWRQHRFAGEVARMRKALTREAA